MKKIISIYGIMGSLLIAMLPGVSSCDKLEDELFHYQSSDDLGQLETGQSAFKRGLAKTTTKNRQYRMNKKRMSDIEQRLAELRGE